MATNPWINNFAYTPEQDLIAALTTELIQTFGYDFTYLPRTHRGLSQTFTEDAASEFTTTFVLEMYIKKFDNFGGAGDIMTKFGLSQNDQLSVCVSRTRFSEVIGSVINSARPREGDLIWFPMTHELMEITFVEHESSFYQRGALQFYELTLEKFEYSNELFATGVAEIDAVFIEQSTDTSQWLILASDGSTIVTTEGDRIVFAEFDLDAIEPFEIQNNLFDKAVTQYTDFKESDPFNENLKY